MASEARQRVAVVGGGITGLAAAAALLVDKSDDDLRAELTKARNAAQDDLRAVGTRAQANRRFPWQTDQDVLWEQPDEAD